MQSNPLMGLNIKEKLPLYGVSLVEASAGTGKTYSITKIILQALLLDNNQLFHSNPSKGKDNIDSGNVKSMPHGSVKIEEILVVTFTEAATKELRGKIREELHKFERYLTSLNQEPRHLLDTQRSASKGRAIEKAVQRTAIEEASLLDTQRSASKGCAINPTCGIHPNEECNKSDDVYDAIIKIANKSEEEQLKLINQALLNIDQAAIYTIHSFCQRMLTENAFESKIAFGAELLTDTSELIKEIAENFWRKNFVNISAGEKGLYENIKFSDILDLTTTFIKYNSVELVNVSDENLSLLKEKYSGVFEKIDHQLSQWDIDQLESEMLEFFGEHAGNFKKPLGIKYFEETITNVIKDIKNHSLTLKDMTIFSSSYISENIFNKSAETKGFELPYATFFTIGEDLSTLVEMQQKKDAALYKELYEYINIELNKIKESRHILTFNDLIKKLYDIVEEESKQKNDFNTLNDGAKPYLPQGVSLTELIKNRYKIAFVDEFQDTDKQQYSIFKNIFENSNRHGFFMIGDPKQSIYKFRGADIFSYLKAKKDANNRYTLLKNFRSEKGMINGVNSIFQFRKQLINNNVDSQGDSDNVFVSLTENSQEGIAFAPAEFGANNEKSVITVEKSPQNLQLWLVDGFNSSFIEYNIAKNIALEITKLISTEGSSGATLESEKGGKSLTLGDIAILVNTNKQALKIKHELSKSNIPAVIQRTAKIFESRQATEIKLWLKAIIKPIERNIRPLFVTDILRKSVDEIESVQDIEILAITEELTLLKQRCKDEGFFSTFIHFMKIFQVMENALKHSNGERVITNYFHISDLLHKHELKSGRNIEKTLSYLEEEIVSESSDDEKQEQLESDKNAVKIMTIHKSKGLQFSVVFCPYIWSNSITKGETKQKVLPFTECEDGEFIQKLDLGADKELFKERQDNARVETLAEYVRVLYVALTRAENRCYLAVGDDESLAKSVLAYIFTSINADYAKGIPVGNGKKIEGSTFATLSDLQKEAIDNIELLMKSSGDTINVERRGAVYPQPYFNESKKSEEISLFAKGVNVSLLQQWSVGSFSSLISNMPYHADLAKNGDGAFGLPKGKVFGTAVHKIFENYYKKGDAIFSDPSLRKYYFESPLESESFFCISEENEAEKRFNCAEEMFRNVLSANIATDDVSFTLNEISLKDAKPEFTFFHTINKISPTILRDLFADFATSEGKECSTMVENLDFSMRNGYMNGEIDLLFRKDNKYFILDWKTNHLGADFANYTPDKIEENMCKHLYMLQAHIYSFATHLFLKQQLKDYDYDRDFGGFIYIYTRGVDKNGNGIYTNKPPRALIEKMEQTFCLR